MVRVLSKNVGGLRSAQTNAGSKVSQGDARFKIIAKNRSRIGDARDKLSQIAKTTDARHRIEKRKNGAKVGNVVKAGNPNIKTTRKGGITITTTKKGSLQLTTKKNHKEAPQPAAKPKSELAKKLALALYKSISESEAQQARPKLQRKELKTNRPALKRPIANRDTGRLNRQYMSAAARLDEELLSTRVDPLVIKRTIRQSMARRSPPIEYARPSAYIDSRPPLFTHRKSPERMDYESYMRESRQNEYVSAPAVRSRYDYDDPRRETIREDEIYKRRLLQSQLEIAQGRTLADKYSETGGNFNSPLQGTKVVVGNLQESVSQEDITELFGEMGPLKRVKQSTLGSFEVVFVNKDDAVRAVDAYHNRQLDGKAMKCSIAGVANTISSIEPKFSAFPRGSSRDAPHPDLGAVHRALFMDRTRPAPGSRPLFNVSMSRK